MSLRSRPTRSSTVQTWLLLLQEEARFQDWSSAGDSRPVMSLINRKKNIVKDQLRSQIIFNYIIFFATQLHIFIYIHLLVKYFSKSSFICSYVCFAHYTFHKIVWNGFYGFPRLIKLSLWWHYHLHRYFLIMVFLVFEHFCTAIFSVLISNFF